MSHSIYPCFCCMREKQKKQKKNQKIRELSICDYLFCVFCLLFVFYKKKKINTLRISHRFPYFWFLNHLHCIAFLQQPYLLLCKLHYITLLLSFNLPCNKTKKIKITKKKTHTINLILCSVYTKK